jgi:ElaB/YqjD/DUF883 family membrane-anchored ribosome-binding protein
MRNRLKEYESDLAHGENAKAIGADVATITNEAQNWLANVAGEIEEFVTVRPAVALSAALALGVFVGWLLKRR